MYCLTYRKLSIHQQYTYIVATIKFNFHSIHYFVILGDIGGKLVYPRTERGEKW